MSLLDNPPCLPPKSPKSKLAMKQIGLIDEDLIYNPPYHKLQAIQKQLVEKYQQIQNQRIQQVINQRKQMEEVSINQRQHLVIQYEDETISKVKKVDPKLILAQKAQKVEQEYRAKKQIEEANLKKLEAIKKQQTKEKIAEVKMKRGEFEKQLLHVQQYTQQKFEKIQEKYIKKEQLQNELQVQKIKTKQDQIEQLQITREQKELKMKLYKQKMEEEYKLNSQFKKEQQEKLFKEIRENIQVQHNIRSQQLRSFYITKNQQVNQYFDQYYLELDEMDDQIQQQLQNAEKRQKQIIKQKQQDSGQKLNQRLLNQSQNFRSLQHEVQINNSDLLLKKDLLQKQASNQRKVILDEKVDTSLKTQFNSQICRTRYQMQTAQENYDATISLYLWEQQIMAAQEAKKDINLKDKIIEQYTFTDVSQQVQKQEEPQFNLNEFLNFNDLGEGFYKGQQLKIMYDRALFMEEEREKLRQNKIDDAKTELEKVNLRQVFCKERRESSKILKVLEGMYKVEGKGRIL